jgi:hypothetical protein
VVSSTMNKAKKKTAILQAAVPAPFAQAFKTSYFGAMSTLLAQPSGQLNLPAGDEGWWDYDPGMAQAPNGNLVVAWDRGYCPSSGGSICYINYDIDYTILNYGGAVVRPLSKLTDNNAQTTQTMDEYPAVAVAPNGSIGVIWYRYLRNNSTSQINYNIFFAILDDAGEITYGPTNLTNNAVWGTSSSQYVPSFSNPQISATGDNRFILAWHEFYYGATSGNCSSYCAVDDIYYAVRDTVNTEILPVTQFSYDTSGWDEGYTNPNLTALAGNRALLTWSRHSDYDVYYAGLGSDGSLVMGQTDLSKDKWKKSDYAPDAVQLSDGRILIAWGCYDNTGDNIRFSVLDANFKQVVSPKLLKNPAAVTGNAYVSVTADAAGRAILTWTDSSYYFRRNLYYALLTSKGKIITPPMVFQTSPDKFMLTSYVGNGNTSYLSNPAAMPALSNKFTPAPDWNGLTDPIETP